MGRAVQHAIGMALHEARTRQEVPHEAIAEATGKSRWTTMRWHSGRGTPGIVDLFTCCRLYKVSVPALFRRVEDFLVAKQMTPPGR